VIGKSILAAVAEVHNPFVDAEEHTISMQIRLSAAADVGGGNHPGLKGVRLLVSPQLQSVVDLRCRHRESLAVSWYP
jgi:hypothetical protein